MGGQTLLSAVELFACQRTWVTSAGLQPLDMMSARPGHVQQDGFVSLLRGPPSLQRCEVCLQLSAAEWHPASAAG